MRSKVAKTMSPNQHFLPFFVSCSVPADKQPNMFPLYSSVTDSISCDLLSETDLAGIPSHLGYFLVKSRSFIPVTAQVKQTFTSSVHNLPAADTVGLPFTAIHGPRIYVPESLKKNPLTPQTVTAANKLVV